MSSTSAASSPCTSAVSSPCATDIFSEEEVELASRPVENHSVATQSIEPEPRHVVTPQHVPVRTRRNAPPLARTTTVGGGGVPLNLSGASPSSIDRLLEQLARTITPDSTVNDMAAIFDQYEPTALLGTPILAGVPESKVAALVRFLAERARSPSSPITPSSSTAQQSLPINSTTTTADAPRSEQAEESKKPAPLETENQQHHEPAPFELDPPADLQPRERALRALGSVQPEPAIEEQEEEKEREPSQLVANFDQTVTTVMPPEAGGQHPAGPLEAGRATENEMPDHVQQINLPKTNTPQPAAALLTPIQLAQIQSVLTALTPNAPDASATPTWPLPPRATTSDSPSIETVMRCVEELLTETASSREGSSHSASDVPTRSAFQCTAATVLRSRPAPSMKNVAAAEFSARNETSVTCHFDRSRPSSGTLVAVIVCLCDRKGELPENLKDVVPPVVHHFHALFKRVGAIEVAVSAAAATISSSHELPFSLVFSRRLTTFFFACQYYQLFVPDYYSQDAFADTFTFINTMAHLRSVRASWRTEIDRDGGRFDKHSGFELQHTTRLAQLVALRQLLINARVNMTTLDNKLMMDPRLTFHGIEPYRRCTSLWIRDRQDNECFHSSLAYAALILAGRLRLATFAEEHAQLKSFLFQRIGDCHQNRAAADTEDHAYTLFTTEKDLARYCVVLEEGINHVVHGRLASYCHQAGSSTPLSASSSKPPTPSSSNRCEWLMAPTSPAAAAAVASTDIDPLWNNNNNGPWFENIPSSSVTPSTAAASGTQTPQPNPATPVQGSTPTIPTLQGPPRGEAHFFLRPVCSHVVQRSLREPPVTSSSTVYLAATTTKDPMAPHHIGVINGFDGDNCASLWDPSPTGSGSAFPDPPLVRLVEPPCIRRGARPVQRCWTFFELHRYREETVAEEVDTCTAKEEKGEHIPSRRLPEHLRCRPHCGSCDGPDEVTTLRPN